MTIEINQMPRPERDPGLLRHLAFNLEDALEQRNPKGVNVNPTQARTIKLALFHLADRIDLD